MTTRHSQDVIIMNENEVEIDNQVKYLGSKYKPINTILTSTDTKINLNKKNALQFTTNSTICNSFDNKTVIKPEMTYMKVKYFSNYC